jgi:hypothetical protein
MMTLISQRETTKGVIIMATAEIGNEELVPRIEKAIAVMKELREALPAMFGQEKVRLTNKIEGMELVLNAQRERLQNMKTPQDVVTLAAMIATNQFDPKYEQGIKLVQSYLMEYAA